MAFPTGWGRYCAVVIDADQISGTSHSDFPVLITEDMLPSEMFDADGSYPALNGGGDIRFTTDTAGSNGLHCEVVSFVTDNNPANGSAEIWVKVPTLSGSSDTTIYVWYNATGESQPAASDATFGSYGVWSSAQTVLLMEDSTPIDHTGTHSYTKNGASAVTEISGPFGSAIAIPSGASFSNTDAALKDIPTTHDFTVSVISRRDSYSDGSSNGAALSFEGTDDLILYPTENSASVTNGTRCFWRDLGGSSLAANSVSSINVWQWSSVTSRASNDHELYVNGNSVDTSSSTGTAGPFVGFYVGAFGSLGQPFVGDIAQVVVWASARSDEWVATEYANQNSPATFAAAGTPVSAGGGGVSVALTGNSSTSAIGTLTVSAEASVSVTPTGVASSSAIGTLGVTAEINASAELSGIAATSAVGTLTAEVGGGTTAALSGVTGTSAAGTLTATGQVNAFVDLLGNSATCAAGTLIVVTGLQVALSGNAATGAVGTLGVTAEVNASATLTGVGSSGAVGTLEVTVPITTSVELTGVGATGAIGTLTAVGAGQIWTEVPATSTTWTEIS